MTQDEIIRSPIGREQLVALALEAGFHIENWSFGERVSVYESGKTIDITNELKDFAALIAAHEREACAKVCDEMYRRDGFAAIECEAADECAAAIRSRSSEH